MRAKYFEPDYRERLNGQTILSSEFAVGSAETVTAQNERMSLKAYPTQSVIHPGNRASLVVEIDLKPKMHLYAPGVQGYRAVTLEMVGNPSLKLHDARYPKAEVLLLPAIRERVPVFRKRLRITRDFTLPASSKEQMLNIDAVLKYQACDDKKCYLPDEIPLKFTVKIEPLDFQRAPEAIRKRK